MKKDKHYVVVYGTLLEGECNAHVAGEALRLPCAIIGTLYDTGYGFPAFELKGDTTIEAEFLEVDDETFRRIDRLEGYPTLYRRSPIRATLFDGSIVMGWVYIMNKLPKGAKVIESGSWRQR